MLYDARVIASHKPALCVGCCVARFSGALVRSCFGRRETKRTPQGAAPPRFALLASMGPRAVSFTNTPAAKRRRVMAAVSPKSPGTAAERQKGWVECPLVQRVPKVPRGADTVETIRKEAETDGFIEAINTLWNRPDLVQDCVGFLRKVLVQPGTSSEWVSPSSPGKIDKDFVVSLLGAQSGALSSKWFDNLNCANDTFIHELLSFMTQWPLQTPIPDCAKDDRILVHKALVARLKEVGRVAFVAKHVKSNGYDKTVGGAYKLVFIENTVS